MRVAPVFFTQTSDCVAASCPVAWMISTRLLSRSSATSAEETRALPARLMAGISAATTEPMATMAATVSKMVEIDFSMAGPP